MATGARRESASFPCDLTRCPTAYLPARHAREVRYVGRTRVNTQHAAPVGFACGENVRVRKRSPVANCEPLKVQAAFIPYKVGFYSEVRDPNAIGRELVALPLASVTKREMILSLLSPRDGDISNVQSTDIDIGTFITMRLEKSSFLREA